MTRRRFSIPAETERASMSVVDLISQTYAVRTHHGGMYTDNVYTLVRRNDGRFSLCVGKDELGALVPVDPYTGLIWQGGTCLGQYAVEGDEDVVYPHRNGTRQESKKRHALDYLLDGIEKG